MHKEDNRTEYQKQALKLKYFKKQSLKYYVQESNLHSYDKICEQIASCSDEVEKQEKILEQEQYIQGMRWEVRRTFMQRKNHEHHRQSPEHTYATKIDNHRNQDKLVQTLAKYVKHKNDYYLQNIH